MSSRNDIHTFLLSGQTGNAEIDTINHTVCIEVAAGTDLSCLVPVITVSEMATISPASGILQDFSSQKAGRSPTIVFHIAKHRSHPVQPLASSQQPAASSQQRAASYQKLILFYLCLFNKTILSQNR